MDNISTDILGSVVKFVEQEDIFSLAKTNKQLYKAVLLHYHFDDYKLLLKLSTEPARLGSDADFNIILKNVNVDPEVIFKAIIKGNKHQLLKNYLNKIDPSLDDNWAIRKASKKGYYIIVKLLLDLPLERGVHEHSSRALHEEKPSFRVDPSANNNYAIQLASKNGHEVLVKLLLDLPLERGVDPSAKNNYAIRYASVYDYTSIVKLLLDLPLKRGVDPSANDNKAIIYASRYSHKAVVKLLATSSKISLAKIPNLKILDIIIKFY